jgi:hypothetical protein
MDFCLGAELILRRLDDKDVFAVHLWNELSTRLKMDEIDENSVFMQLAKVNCPNVYERELRKQATGNKDDIKDV